MGFIHYNNTIAEQLAHVQKTKRHIPGYVVTPAVLPPTATVADVIKLQVRVLCARISMCTYQCASVSCGLVHSTG